MINLQLKAKHYYLIADILFSTVALTSFTTLQKIKTACEGVADDDIVSIEIDIDTILNMYRILTIKPEGSYNNINTEMFDLLTLQIANQTALGELEWIELATRITDIRSQNLAVAINAIQSGKNKLYN